jgi:hypothetical protein
MTAFVKIHIWARPNMTIEGLSEAWRMMQRLLETQCRAVAFSLAEVNDLDVLIVELPDEAANSACELAKAAGFVPELVYGYQRTEDQDQVEFLKSLRAGDLAADVPVCRCGMPMLRNPHPLAGAPDKTVEIGAMWECIPCLVDQRHRWCDRALAAERQLNAVKEHLAASPLVEQEERTNEGL